MVAQTVRGLIERNLTGIVLGAVALYGGYITGQVTTREQIEALRKIENENREARLKHRNAIACLIRHIDRLESGVTGNGSPCPLELTD